MYLGHMKKLRVVVSVFVFAILFLIFLDVENAVTEPVSEFLLSLQFFPSVFNTIALFFSVTTMGFVLILIVTLIWGRLYCSSLCPLGTFQDLLIRAGAMFKSRKNRQFAYSAGNNRLRYIVLLATLIFWVFGSLFLINLLDPYSNFGKITVTLFKPAYIWLNNQLAFTLENFNVFIVTPLMPVSLPGEVIAISASIFLLLLAMSIWKGRLFCNTLCPVGSILSLVAQKSLYRIAIKQEACNTCRRCEKVCKAECIDSKLNIIDHGRCVSCFNCFAACTNKGFYYKFSYAKADLSGKTPIGNDLPDPSKRSFLLTIVTTALSIPFIQKARAYGTSASGMIPSGTKLPVMPPGAISYENFTGKCIACYLCVSACPKNVIVPSFFDYGLDGFMQPKMDFHKSFCNFDCTSCSGVCPTGALRELDLPTKQVTQLGVAKFLYESCIVTVYRTDCGACSEHCPVKAVDMVPYNGLWLPQVKPELCIGCGACEFACPTMPYKAIYVEANRVHQKALPVTTDQGPRDHEMEEFPF